MDLGLNQYPVLRMNPVNDREAVVATKPKSTKAQMPPHVGFVDLRSHYDEVLMSRFYTEMMEPNFPDADELDALDYMKQMVLSRDDEDSTYSENRHLDYHIIVMISFPEPYDTSKTYDFSKENFKGQFMGAVVFEYYIQANAGLLTYLLVQPGWRGLSLGTLLSQKCQEGLEAQAKERGHLAGCNAIFLETDSAIKISQDRPGVMDPSKRHEIFYGMGLRLVDFDYVQPPLSPEKNKVNYLLLTCFITPRIPSYTLSNGKEQYYLPTGLVRNTMYAFWVNAPMRGRKFNEDVDYRRMQDQLRRREKILLLDLPWERPFTVVDLAEHFDLELLVQFYQDLLVPCYRGRQDELESLDHWLELLSPNHGRPDDSNCFHLFLALQYSDDADENSKPMIAGGLSFEYFGDTNCGFLTYLLAPIGTSGDRMARALIDRALATLDDDAKSNGQLGGCNMVFMECSQQGASATPIVPKAGPISNQSSHTSSAALLSNIPSTPSTNTPTPSTSTPASIAPFSVELSTEVRDIDEQHPLLESMGWKLVDFDYIQPPNRDPAKKVKSMLLIALVTSRIPVLHQEDRSHRYVPATTLKKFMSDLWEASCDRLNYNYKEDHDFLSMMEHLDRRQQIPLLGRPWTKPWTMSDLHEQNNPRLLAQFYEELLVPAFASQPDRLEPLAVWKSRLVAHGGEIFHTLVAVKSTSDSPITNTNKSLTPNQKDDSGSNNLNGSNSGQRQKILGGLAFIYYEGNNCGFITHVLICDTPQREVVAKSLMERAVEILDQDALARGHLAGCNAIFLETGENDETTPSEKISNQTSSSTPTVSSSALVSLNVQAKESPVPTQVLSNSSVLDISSHHLLLHRLGWRLIDFNYVTPPSNRRKPQTTKSLALFLTRRVPKAEVLTDDVYYYLPRHTLSNFLHDYWRLHVTQLGLDYHKDPHFKHMMDLVSRRERIPLLDLPWTRPWTLVDLWEDFDAQLLYKFYQNHYTALYPNKSDREPLSTWLQLLSEESRDSPSIEDFHVLIALQNPVLTGSVATATKSNLSLILGGLLFTYYTSNSCGLLSFMTVPSNLPSYELLSKSLLDEACMNLNENAALRGHLAGCNAIFMEAPFETHQSRPNHQYLHKAGWRMVNFEYYRPPQSIFSSGGTPLCLLVLLTPNIPKHVDPVTGAITHTIPKETVKSFLWQHWRNTYHRVGKTLVARDVNFQQMLSSLESTDQITLKGLPWVSSESKL